MTKRRDISKEEKQAERFLKSVWKEIRKMLDWLLFYKPKDKFDKTWHVFEVFIVWSIVIRIFTQ